MLTDFSTERNLRRRTEAAGITPAASCTTMLDCQRSKYVPNTSLYFFLFPCGGNASQAITFCVYPLRSLRPTGFRKQGRYGRVCGVLSGCAFLQLPQHSIRIRVYACICTMQYIACGVSMHASVRMGGDKHSRQVCVEVARARINHHFACVEDDR